VTLYQCCQLGPVGIRLSLRIRHSSWRATICALSPIRPIALIAALASVSAAQQPSTTTGTVLVANQQSASATIIDVATKAATTIDVGAGPHETVISPDGKWGVVTIYGVGGAPGNKLAIIDLSTKTVMRTVDLGTYTRPHAASFVPGSSSRLFVTSETTQNVVLVDIAAGRPLAAVPTQHPGSHMLGITADGKHLYTANISWGGISEIDPQSWPSCAICTPRRSLRA